MKRKVCILGVHHDYQFCVPRLQYLQNVENLIITHTVDVVAEEASGIQGRTYAQVLIEKRPLVGVEWKNVDLTRDERSAVPDVGFGALVDYELHRLREWVWVIRTSKVMKDSALLICGYCHTFSIADKLQESGFDVETNVHFDKADIPRLISQ